MLVSPDGSDVRTFGPFGYLGSMRKGQRIRISTLTAPHGRVMESLRPEFEARTIGVVKFDSGYDWFAVQFPTLEDGDRLQIHRSMIDVV